MDDKKTPVALLTAVAAIVLSAVAILKPVPAPQVVQVEPQKEPSFGALAGPDVMSYLNVQGGRLTASNGFVEGKSIATSTTATTQTLVLADIKDYSSVRMTPNIAAVTLTLPAVSTLTTMIPNDGEIQRQCWKNATTTAGTNITFAAGSGMDLESGTTTLAIAPGNTGCLTYLRTSSSVMTVIFQPFVDAD